jgi:hypothetical protein
MNFSLNKQQTLKLTGIQSPVVCNWPPLAIDQLFVCGNKELIWKKYCGFLDISIEEFMVIQKMLLMEQIELVKGSVLGSEIIGLSTPHNIDEFRRITPLTQYKDYQPYLDPKNSKAISAKLALWIQSSEETDAEKWVPFPLHMISALVDDSITALILASASRKGEVLLEPNTRLALHLYSNTISGIIGRAISQRLHFQAVPPVDEVKSMKYEERIDHALSSGLRTGLDYATAAAETLAKAGENWSGLKGKPGSFFDWHPLAAYRLLKARIKAGILKRSILPKDIWKIKGLVCAGTDSNLYRDIIYHCWGVYPLEVYASTETCFMAVQSWNKKGLTFIPYRHFYEFIPEEELSKSGNNEGYQPSTVLLNELKPGKVYELVVTNFHGGLFLRYRLGDLIKVIALKDEETKVNLPQVVLLSRSSKLF